MLFSVPRVDRVLEQAESLFHQQRRDLERCGLTDPFVLDALNVLDELRSEMKHSVVASISADRAIV